MITPFKSFKHGGRHLLYIQRKRVFVELQHGARTHVVVLEARRC